MAFILVSQTYNPSDGGSAAGPTYTMSSNPFNWATGDLAIVFVQFKGTGTLSVSGNQAWNTLPQQANGTTSIGRVFWCIWDAGLTINETFGVASGTTALTVRGFAFRPTSTSNSIFTDGISSNTFTGAAATVTIPGRTTNYPSTVTMAAWMSEDDNTWSSLSGTGWTVAYTNLYVRNLQGTDQSMGTGYCILNGSTTVNDVSNTMGGVGADPGIWYSVTFAEDSGAPPPAFSPSDPFGMMGFFGV